MLDKFTSWLQVHLMPLADKISNNKVLQAVKDGFLTSLPITMFGSLVLALVNIPFLDQLIGAETLAAIQAYATPIQNVTFNLVSMLVVVATAYSLAKSYKLNAIFAAITSFVGFMIMIPTFSTEDAVVYYQLNDFSSVSLFMGIIVSVITVYLYKFVVDHNWTIKLPESVPEMVTDSFSSLIPSGFVLLVCFFVQLAFRFTPFETLNNFVYTILQAPLSSLGATLPAFLVSGMLMNLFWFFGLHGNNIVYNSVLSPIFKALSLENLTAFQAHAALPHIITEEFAFYFGGFNGSFIAYPVLICIFLFFRKKREWNELGKVALVPGIFSIYEPIVFGLPLMLNPIFLIPMLLTPVVSTLIAYGAMAVGLCPLCTGVSVPWTCPMILSGVITTNSIAGGIVQLVTIVVLTVLWYVFLKAAYKPTVENDEPKLGDAPAEEVA